MNSGLISRWVSSPHTHTYTHLICHRHLNPFTHINASTSFIFFSLQLTLVHHLPPSLSLHAWCLLCICLSKKRLGTELLCGFCFGLPCYPFCLHPVHPHLAWRLPMTKEHDHTLSTYLSISFFFSLRCPSPHLFLLSPVFMYLWFSLKPSAPESPLDPENPWNLEWAPSHTPTPQTPLARTGPQRNFTMSRHLNGPATARRSNAVSDANTQAKGTGLFIPPQHWGFDFGWAEETH